MFSYFFFLPHVPPGSMPVSSWTIWLYHLHRPTLPKGLFLISLESTRSPNLEDRKISICCSKDSFLYFNDVTSSNSNKRNGTRPHVADVKWWIILVETYLFMVFITMYNSPFFIGLFIYLSMLKPYSTNSLHYFVHYSIISIRKFLMYRRNSMHTYSIHSHSFSFYSSSNEALTFS